MGNTLGIIFEIIVLIFNILIYMELTVPKKDTPATRNVMYIGGIAILSLFFVCTYFLKMPEVLSSFLCVTLPSFSLFFALSKYKDFRFLVTFCFLDTTTLIITFFARMADILGGHTAGSILSAIVIIAMFLIYIKGKPLFKQYRQLLKNINDSWAGMAIATLAIYFLLVFSASFPKPLIERAEYLVSYAALSVTILTVYVVFVLSLMEKKKLSDLNAQLTREKVWHRIAYEDALTGLKNRMAYIEKINELERKKSEKESIHAIMIDIDHFKHINDSLGHHVGDTTLQQTANYLLRVFQKENYMLFRIGGDEFAVIAVNLPDSEIAERCEYIDQTCKQELACTISVGICKVNPSENKSIESAFKTADRRMYEQKASKL